MKTFEEKWSAAGDFFAAAAAKQTQPAPALPEPGKIVRVTVRTTTMINIVSKARVRAFGEVFTPPNIVSQMLDLLDPEIWSDPTCVVLEPCCGKGAFVVAAFDRMFSAMLNRTSDPALIHRGVVTAGAFAIARIRAMDIQPDNVLDTRAALRSKFHERVIPFARDGYTGKFVSDLLCGLEVSLAQNVVCCDALKAMDHPRFQEWAALQADCPFPELLIDTDIHAITALT